MLTDMKQNIIKNLKSYLYLFFLSAIMPGCYYDSVEALYPQIGSTCDTTNVTYTSVIEPMINDHCIQCHSGTYAPTLVTYNDLSSNATVVYGAISYSSGYTPMPQGAPKLNDCLINQMDIWINTGKPQ
jgi:hypothetical protein